MNKIEFLWKLQNALRWTFSKEEIADVMRDYESFFVTGNEEGKTEQEICTNLGDPSAIAQELADSSGKKKSKRIVKQMALTSALFLIGLAYYFAVYESNNIIRDSILMLTVFDAVLWFTIGGTFCGSPPVSCTKNAYRKWLLPIGHILLILMVAIFFILLHLLETKLLSGIDILSYAAIVINLRTVFFAIALIVGAFSIYGFYRLSTQFFFLTSHAVSVVAYLSAAYNIMSRLDTPENFNRYILLLFVFYGISIIITSLFAFFIRTTSRKGIK